MTLPASGTISLGNNTGDTTTISTNRELGYASPWQEPISMNDSAVRDLFGKLGAGTQISMSDGWGKSSNINLVISANTTAGYNIKTAVGGAYIAGKSHVVLTINSGVYVGAPNITTPAIDTGTGWVTGDTITIINNGYITGHGGGGGAYGISGQNASHGIIMHWPIAVDNAAGYIYAAGGGGGGGAYGWDYSSNHTGGGGGGGGGGYIAGLGNVGGIVAGGGKGGANGGNGNLTYGGAGGSGGLTNRGNLGGTGGAGGNRGGYGVGQNGLPGVHLKSTISIGLGGNVGYSIYTNALAVTWISGSSRAYGYVGI